MHRRRSYTLPAVDTHGRLWDFVVKSWANGSEHRRVFVLEQVRPQLSCPAEGSLLGNVQDRQRTKSLDFTKKCIALRQCACMGSLVSVSQFHGVSLHGQTAFAVLPHSALL